MLLMEEAAEGVSGSPPPDRHPQCPGSRSYQLSLSNIQHIVAEHACVPGADDQETALPQSHQGRLDHAAPPTSKLITDKYLLEATAGQGSKGSPFPCNCHCFHENISFQVYCQTSVF